MELYKPKPRTRVGGAVTVGLAVMALTSGCAIGKKFTLEGCVATTIEDSTRISGASEVRLTQVELENTDKEVVAWFEDRYDDAETPIYSTYDRANPGPTPKVGTIYDEYGNVAELEDLEPGDCIEVHGAIRLHSKSAGITDVTKDIAVYETIRELHE